MAREFHKEMDQYLHQRKRDRTPLHHKLHQRIKNALRSQLAGEREVQVESNSEVQIIKQEKNIFQKWMESIREFMYSEKEDKIVDDLEHSDIISEGEHKESDEEIHDEFREERPGFFAHLFKKKSHNEEIDQEKIDELVEKEDMQVATKVVLMKSQADKDLKVAVETVEVLLKKLSLEEKNAFMTTESYKKYEKIKK